MYKYGRNYKKDRSHLERVDIFLKQGYTTLAEVFAKSHFLDQHKRKGYPEYYEDLSGKGIWYGKFEHPDVIKGAQKIMEERKQKLGL